MEEQGSICGGPWCGGRGCDPKGSLCWSPRERGGREHSMGRIPLQQGEDEEERGVETINE